MKNKPNENEGTSGTGTALQLKELIGVIVEYVAASNSPCKALAAVVSAITCGVMALEREASRHLSNGRH